MLHTGPSHRRKQHHARGTRPFLVDLQRAVAAAQAAGRPLVALESTIIAHGMPYPENVRTAREVEAVIRGLGAEPATIAVMGGRIRIGLSDDELELLGRSGQAAR
jgi:pseudouridine-5'-phosphate glycosidase